MEKEEQTKSLEEILETGTSFFCRVFSVFLVLWTKKESNGEEVFAVAKAISRLKFCKNSL